MEFHETVRIEGENDSTHGLIQRGLTSVPKPQPASSEGQKRKHKADAEASEALHVETCTQDDLHVIARFSAGGRAKEPERRTRMRIVLKVFGCSIRFYASLPELIELLLHGVYGT